MHEKHGKKRAGAQSPPPGGGGGLEKGLRAPPPPPNTFFRPCLKTTKASKGPDHHASRFHNTEIQSLQNKPKSGSKVYAFHLNTETASATNQDRKKVDTQNDSSDVESLLKTTLCPFPTPHEAPPPPPQENASESNSTLQFANYAKQIKCHTTKNVVLSPTELQVLHGPAEGCDEEAGPSAVARPGWPWASLWGFRLGVARFGLR